MIAAIVIITMIVVTCVFYELCLGSLSRVRKATGQEIVDERPAD